MCATRAILHSFCKDAMVGVHQPTTQCAAIASNQSMCAFPGINCVLPQQAMPQTATESVGGQTHHSSMGRSRVRGGPSS